MAVYGLEVEWSHLLEKVSLDDVADIVSSHDISVHVFLTARAIKSTEVNLANELPTSRAFL